MVWVAPNQPVRATLEEIVTKLKLQPFDKFKGTPGWAKRIKQELAMIGPCPVSLNDVGHWDGYGMDKRDLPQAKQRWSERVETMKLRGTGRTTKTLCYMLTVLASGNRAGIAGGTHKITQQELLRLAREYCHKLGYDPNLAFNAYDYRHTPINPSGRGSREYRDWEQNRGKGPVIFYDHTAFERLYR